MDSIDNGRRTSSQSLEVDPTKSGPQPVLGYFDSIALIVGIVVGAGIFSFPALVAANSAGWQSFLLVWVMGGLVSLVGALCYAELASTFPSAGGDYHFLKCASRGRGSFPTHSIWVTGSRRKPRPLSAGQYTFGVYPSPKTGLISALGMFKESWAGGAIKGCIST